MLRIIRRSWIGSGATAWTDSNRNATSLPRPLASATDQEKFHRRKLMKTVPAQKLSQEGCDIIVEAAIAKAKELKQIVSICVVDAGGHLMAFKRMTNGRTHNTLIAQAKARCAALPTAATG